MPSLPNGLSTVRRSLLLSAAAIGLLFAANTAHATATEASCQDAVAGAGIKYFSAVVKAVGACELGRSADSPPALTTVCRPSVGINDTPTSDAVTAAQTKLSDTITKKCEGIDISTMSFGKPCESVTNADALAACIRDDGHGADAENLINTIFDATGAISQQVSRDCQAAVVSAASKYAQAQMKNRRKCAKSLAGGKIPGPCPDAKTSDKLTKAMEKFKDTLAGACTQDALDNLDAGFPCDLYVDSTYQSGSNFTGPVKYARCLASATAGAGELGADTAQPIADAEPFSYGVAAGDETDTAFIAWTRTSDGVNPVTLQVTTDPTFATVTQTLTPLSPDGAADNTVHAEVTGLTKSTSYYYRFTQNGSTSRVGRVKTTPAAADAATVTFGWTGDSNAYFRPFSVLENITAANPDAWFFIGDTIYGDDPRSGTGVAQVRSDYHTKYKENFSDRALRDLMSSMGTYTIWDDHEVTNDFWGTDPAIATQMAAGNQAFRDYMPLRVNVGDPMKLYRSVRMGTNVEFFLLDARQYRSAQADVTEPACVDGVCTVGGTPGTTGGNCNVDTNPCGVGETCQLGTCTDPNPDACSTNADCTVVGETCQGGACAIESPDPCSINADCGGVGVICKQNQGMSVPNSTCQDEIDNPARTYLGSGVGSQLEWLEQGLLNSTAKWKLVMNGPVISNITFVPYDRWEGYTAEREALLDFIDTNNIKNVVFLSTDIHAAIINNDIDGNFTKELVSGAIGMDPIIRELPPSVSSLIGNLPLIYPNVVYFDLDRFNTTTATVTATQLKMTWKDGSGQTLKTFTIPAQ